MHRIGLNTAIMSFAFTGVLAPHRHSNEERLAAPQTYGRSTEWDNAPQRAGLQPAAVDSPIQPTAERAASPGSVWLGALIRRDR